MKISVLMSVLNGEAYLEKAVDSILNQTYKDFEFVIVNNGSTDKTTEILDNYEKKDKRIRVLKNTETKPFGDALNQGLEACIGDWVARIDADDISLPERLEKQLLFVEKDSRIKAVGTYGFHIGVTETRLGLVKNPPITIEHFKDKRSRNRLIYLPHPSVFMHRETVLEVGGYRSKFFPTEDVDLWSRLSDNEENILLNMDEPLFLYRVHPGSDSVKKTLKQLANCRWVHMCQIERRAGRPEPDSEIFEQTEKSRSKIDQFKQIKSVYGSHLFKQAATSIISGKYLKGAAFLGLSAAIDPGNMIMKIYRQQISRMKYMFK